MPISRRDFFRHSGETVLWTALLAGLEAGAQDETEEPLAPGETDFTEFWRQAFAPPSAPRRGEGKPAAGSEIQFVQFGPKGPRRVEEIAKTPSDLSPVAGDVMLDITPGRFRSGNSAGEGSQGEFVDTAQLRIDIRQTQAFQNILPMLAWASAAAVSLEKKTKMPSIQGLDFKTVAGDSAISQILLPGGTGSFQLNVTVASKPSPFLKALQELVTVAESVVPVLGLPAISLPALMGFSLLCGKLEGRGRYLISTSEPQEIAVTQTAWPSHSSRALPFPPGDYLMYPFGQDALVLPEFKDLTIENGYLINGKLDPSLTATERAEKTAPGLTYVTMRVSASPIKATTSSKS